jgi:hypothetical protein
MWGHKNRVVPPADCIDILRRSIALSFDADSHCALCNKQVSKFLTSFRTLNSQIRNSRSVRIFVIIILFCPEITVT